MKSSSTALSLAVLLFASFSFSSPARAQSTTAENSQTAKISGMLTDSSGAAVRDVLIHATTVASSGESTREAGQAKSGADGRFELTLPAGRYHLRIGAASFARVEQDFTLAVGEIREWNVRLALEPLSSSVVVSATAEPSAATDSSAPAYVLSSEDIAERQEIWLAPMLESAPGGAISRLGPVGGLTTFFLDGGNSNFTKVLIDGVPVNDAGGAVALSDVDLDNADKVEVVHGASSALLGSDAMTGVVQVLSHRGVTRVPELKLLAEGGMLSTQHEVSQLGGLAGKFDYSGSVAYFGSKGQTPNDFFRDTALHGNFGWKFDEADSLRVTVQNSSSDAGAAGQTLFDPPNLVDHQYFHKDSEGLTWNFATGEHWRHFLRGTESRIREAIIQPPFNFFSLFNRAGFEGQSSYLFPGGSVSAGYVNEVENGAEGGPHERRNNQAGYLEVRYPFGSRVTATAGARAEANGAFGTRVVPRVGVVAAVRKGGGFWGGTRLRASYGLGIKEPDFFQSFSTDPCNPGNPNLSPERSNTFNAGVDQILASERVKLSVNYFHNNFRDIISFGMSPNPLPLTQCPFGTGAFFNTDKARAFGVNSTIEVKPAQWLRFTGNYTYDDTRVQNSPNFFFSTEAPGNRLQKRPLHSALLATNVAYRKMNWNLAGVFVGRRTDNDFHFPSLGITHNAGYVRWDLAASYDFSRHLAVLARVQNLFDRHYQDAPGYPGQELSYRAGIRITLGGE